MTGNGRYGGTIGVMSGELVHADFVVALFNHQWPTNTKLVWAKSVDIVGNMNSMVEQMQGEWLWILGSDHVMDFDLLPRLLEHGVDIVVPLCLRRLPPYDPVVYSHQNEEDDYVVAELPEHGLTCVHAAGTAGMLVRRRVFEAIPAPVFESYGRLNEDLTFCRKAREAGFKIYCDPAARLGHISQVSVWPLWDGEQAIEMQLGNGEKMPLKRIPDATLTEVSR